MPLSIVINSQVGTFQAGTYQLVGTITSSFNSLQSYPVTFSGAVSVSVPIPSTAGGVWIQPPTGNTVGLTVKGLAGDTGIPIGTNEPCILSFPPSGLGANIVITSAGTVTGPTTVVFF